jgi:hypothetical protein
MTGGIDGQRTEPRIGGKRDTSPTVPPASLAENDGDNQGTGSDSASRQAGIASTRQSTAAAATQAAEAARASAESVQAQQRDWSVLRGTLPLFISGLPALLTLIALAFSLFPWLEPAPPPEVRSVTVTDLILGERNKDLGDGRTAHAVFFEVETVGYDAEDIAVDWLLLDAATRERLAEMDTPIRWGVIDIGTRSDRVVGEIEVPPPADHAGCVFVRVLLSPHVVAGETPESPDTGLLLDVADTATFDPFDPTNASCPEPAVATDGST